MEIKCLYGSIARIIIYVSGIAATGTAAHVRSWALAHIFGGKTAQLQTKTM
jgi:hypothetical protein